MTARTGVVVAMLGAAGIHGTVVSEHFALWRPSGLFFLALQVLEVTLAVGALYAWSRVTARLVFVTSVGTVLVWLVSRGVGMPFGPAAFRAPELIGVPDLACCVLELCAAALAAPVAFTPRSRTGEYAGARRLGIAAAAALAVALLAVTAWGLQPSLSGSGRPAHAHSTSGS